MNINLVYTDTFFRHDKEAIIIAYKHLKNLIAAGQSYCDNTV